MASALPPVRGAAFSFEISLVSQADTDTFQDNPTLAAGDIKIVKDGTLDGNIDTLPTAVTSLTRVLTVALSADEMTADRVTILFHDATGNEWQDAVVTIYTATRTIDDLATPTNITAGTINSVLGSVGSVSSGVTIAGTLGTLDALWLKIQKWLRLGFRKDSAVATDHAVELGEINADTGTGVGAYTSTTDSQEALRDRGDAAWLSGSAPSTTDIDTALSATHGAGAWGAGTGVFSKVYTITSGGLPVDGVYCRLTTDAAGLVNVDAGTTNAAGQVTFHHNLAAGTTVYIHRSKAGFTPVAPEPDVEVI